MKTGPILRILIVLLTMTPAVWGQSISPSGTYTLCPNSKVTLTIQNPPNGASFQWKRNGNDIKDSTGLKLEVTEAGTYTVEMSKDGDKSNLNSVVVVLGEAPTVDFTFSPTSTCGVSKISFTNLSSGAVSYNWSFGNGKSSNDKDPQHTFRPAAGSGFDNYVVTLSAKSPSGCTAEQSKTVTIAQRPDASLSSPELTQINGQPYFKICTSVASTFSFSNASSTKADNSRYVIDWGDGSTPYDSNVFDATLTHLYSVGQKKLTFKVYRGQCVDSTVYTVFVGNIPAGGISGVGGSTICTGNAQQFKLENTSSNPEGTIYVLNYSETLVSDTFLHPAPDTVRHSFLKNSCNVSSSNGIRSFPNSFGAYLTITNPCGEAGGSILPIYVSDKPKSDFKITPGDSICENQVVRIQNLGTVQNNVENGVCTPGKFIWNIESLVAGATWTVVGSLGTTNNSESPTAWSSGSGFLDLTFPKAGTYRISLITKNNTLCGADTMIKTICVNPTPTASFTLDNKLGCAPFKVKATGSTNQANCGTNKFQWTITPISILGCKPNTGLYNLLNGSTLNSQSPEFEFLDPGKYVLQLRVFAPGGNCSSPIITDTITVKDKPVVSIPTIPSVCLGQSIAPTMSATCYVDAATTYNWLFADGAPPTSTLLIPGSVSFNTFGDKAITASATNSCGTTSVTVNAVIKPLPTVVDITGESTVCVGSTIQLTNATPSGSWTSSNTSVATVDALGKVTATTAGMVKINYSVTSNGCTKVVTKDLTVNPKPVLTLPARYDVCVGGSASITVEGDADTYTWTPSTGLNTTNGKTVTASPSTSQTYTVTGVITATGCSTTVSTSFNVNPLPTVSVNSPTICEGQSATLTASGAVSFTWSPSTNLNTTTGASVTASPVVTTTYTVTGTNGIGCSKTAEAVVTVNPKPLVTATGATICAGSPITLTAIGADRYTWSAVGLPNQTTASITVSPLATTIYTVTGTNQTTQCSASATALVTVNPLPNVTVNSPTICPGESVQLQANGADEYAWDPANTLSATTGATVTATPASTTTYKLRGTNTSTGCFKETSSIVTVRSIPTIIADASNPTVCNGSNGAINIRNLVANTSYTVNYTLAGSAPTSLTLNSNTSGVLVIPNLPRGTYTKIYISQFNCLSNEIPSLELVDPQPPVQPILASVDPVCSGSTLTFSVTNAGTGTSYRWTGPNSFSQSTTTGQLSINNVLTSAAGTYSVSAIQNACASTPASITAIINPTPLAPTVADITYCQRDIAKELTAEIVSPNSIFWYTAATGGSPLLAVPVPSTTVVGATVFFVSQKTSEGCESARAPLNVYVNSTPNIGQQSQTICSGVPFSINPSGAPANTEYTWTVPVVSIPGSLSGINDQTTPVTAIRQTLFNSSLDVVTALYTISNKAGTCVGPDFELKVTVNPTPEIQNKILNPICSGESFQYSPSVALAGERIPAGTLLSWVVRDISPAGAIIGAGASSSRGSILQQTLFNQTNQVATVSYTVTPYLNDCAGTPFIVTIQVNPQPKIPNLKEIICSEQTVRSILQNAPPTTILPSETLFRWSEPVVQGTNPQAITGGTAQTTGVPAFSQTLINTTSSTQTIVYTVTPTAGSCQGPDFKIEVIVNPKPNLSSYTDTICSGSSFTLLPPQAPLGTTYSWSLPVVVGSGLVTGISEQRTPVSFISQQISTDQSVPIKVQYTVVPSSGSCGGNGFPLEIIVNPTPFIPALTDTICNGTSFEILPADNSNSAIIPGNTRYTWATPTATPTVITGGAAQFNLQNTISQQLFNSTEIPVLVLYKVTPQSGSFGNCVGKPFDVRLIVNPDAKASINPVDTIGCAPLLINAARIRLQPKPQANKEYNWFIDGEFIGSGINIPDYFVNASDDTVLLKLVTTSLHGCTPDSVFKRFITYKVPQSKFSVSDTLGCGPLRVSFTNTTSFKGLFTYRWNFGNGQTSTQSDPSPIEFLPNPNFGDTIYTVKLEVLSACGTYPAEINIRVKSKPKSLFTPSSTVGCSPMRVTFNNTSKGLYNRYVWNFGDGQIDSIQKSGLIEHIYYTAVKDTFIAKLYAINECGVDSSSYSIIVSPNTIKLDYAVNGTQKQGCVNHRVDFINNSQGATLFRWDFGDGNTRSTIKNIDTITHTYLQPGIFDVKLIASNGCTDTTSIERITVYGVPVPDFNIDRNRACIGDSVFFQNRSNSSDSYLWKFGDGKSSTVINPGHRYAQSGNQIITLIAYKTNAPGIVCIDSIRRPVQITDSVNINFNYSDSIANCAPLAVTFKNQYLNNTSAIWDFGNGQRKSGDSVSYTFSSPGTYNVLLNVKAVNGCNYYGSKSVIIRSPFGTVRYISGYSCADEVVRFEALPEFTDSILWDFGDGTKLKTKDRVVFHAYTLAGAYLPKVEFISNDGCSYRPLIRDSIRVDKVTAGFKISSDELCGFTKVVFTDTSNTYYARKSTQWQFGDGTFGNSLIQQVNYRSSNTYNIKTIVTGISGCSDTATLVLPVFVKSIPSIQVIGDSIGCTNRLIKFESKIVSSDSISLIKWRASNNSDFYGSIYTNEYGNAGSYPLLAIAGTKYGCYDTVRIPLNVYATPNVVASSDVTICQGSSIELSASGAEKYTWFPIQDISCINCSRTEAKPLQNTIYTVRGETSKGCYDLDTVLVKVIPKFKMQVSPSDSICIGESVQLLTSGADSYKWLPSESLSSDNVSNPIAKPSRTTTYRVVGSDEFGCFKDTAFITIGVGNYPKVDLGQDLLLPTGALHPLKPSVTEGPIKTWKWMPAKDLSCYDCATPTIRVRNGITYVAVATNYFGCSGSDTLTLKVFCENSQVFIPNAFTPDNDGLNDVFMVRATGIQSIKSLRIFNRWGQLVYDRSNFEPNDPKFAWDGRINGVIGGPDVFVYTLEVICDDGTPYFYKGNLSLLK